jgi:SIR2-like domain
MRIRSRQEPPQKEAIDRIFRDGPGESEKTSASEFVRRLQQSCFLDENCRPLQARDRLIEQYRKDGLVLFLGAGVSRESGIPSWPELTKEMLLASGVAADEIEAIQKALPSLVSQFELARHLLASDLRFVETIYGGLYNKMPCKARLESIPRRYKNQADWPGWPQVHSELKQNKTLAAIGELLIVDDDQVAPRRNRQVHAVLTVNADNLVELYCESRTNGRRVVTMVDRASVGDHPDQTPIYHLHGTLDARGENLSRGCPFELSHDRLQPITDDLLPERVFSESEYYQTIANPSSYVNHTPQSILRRLNVLFVGTSLDDLNMRRWLHDSFRERVQHRTRYLKESCWSKYRDAEYEARRVSLRHFWLRPETEKDMNGKTWIVPKRHVESVMANLGVQIVWCTDFPDLHRCLAELRTNGRNLEFGLRPAQFPV